MKIDVFCEVEKAGMDGPGRRASSPQRDDCPGPTGRSGRFRLLVGGRTSFGS